MRRPSSILTFGKIIATKLARHSAKAGPPQQSNDGDAGNRTPLVPRQQASVWAQYAFAGKAEGLNLGAGLRYVGQAWGDTANTRAVDAYLLADMTVSYDWDANSLAFGVTNLFDKDYAATCDASVGCIKGEGREMTLTLSRRF